MALEKKATGAGTIALSQAWRLPIHMTDSATPTSETISPSHVNVPLVSMASIFLVAFLLVFLPPDANILLLLFATPASIPVFALWIGLVYALADGYNSFLEAPPASAWVNKAARTGILWCCACMGSALFMSYHLPLSMLLSVATVHLLQWRASRVTRAASLPDDAKRRRRWALAFLVTVAVLSMAWSMVDPLNGRFFLLPTGTVI